MGHGDWDGIDFPLVRNFRVLGYVFYEFDYGVLWGSLVVFFTKQFGLCFFSLAFCSLGSVFFSALKTWLVIWFGGVSGGGSLQIISCSYFGALLCSCFVWVLLLLLHPLPKLFEVSGVGSETLPNALGYYFM